MRALFLALFILPLPAWAQEPGELVLVKKVFVKLQPISIRANREYCGYIGYDRSGKLVASKAKRGGKGTCMANDPVNLVRVIASYHTHGAFSTRYANEVPSGDDMETDELEGVDGWVATPGGRLWYIDTTDMVTSQICGIGCLPMDARFREGDMGKIAPSYSYNQLIEKLIGLDD
ncbi:DUF4329 domain-containing protein [Aliiroseovarius sp. F47248L]|uniref:DUF4329 domain-containing protein n=1 Tax=Aliiroseovarius sp. F47248L TaxID=2926420 RepID=UPI001FF5361D|nr:DUF4329 domain-containing protein [Aliiroseovarius sp. F47248L]MCK0138071.1 DUF4329 domain-containing protein [Aliiroseovarius sp. F47248L]